MRCSKLVFFFIFWAAVNIHNKKAAMSYLSEASHGLTGDDLIAVEARDEAQGLVLVLPSFQLAQDQRSKYLHILQRHRG